jgi:hypothetical protein
MSMEQPPPEVLALVVADLGYRDDVSGKFFLLGTRRVIWTRELPLTHPRLAIYTAMIGGRGEVPLELRVLDADEAREPIIAEEVNVSFPDPLTEIEVVFHLTDLVFPEPGEYRFQLFAAGQFLRERRVSIVPLENPGQP